MVRHCLVGLVGALTTSLAPGQTPPPMPLPPTITPAAGSVTQPAAPIARFQTLKDFPPETVQTIYAVRGGAEWLWRMNQANGRFLHGINPALRLPVEGDHDHRQAQAALALAASARFTGDERYAARATQAVLGLLTLTQVDAAAGQRVPVAPSERCNRVGFAAVLVLAIQALPAPDAKLQAQAEELAAFLRSRILADGSIQLFDQPGDMISKQDPEYLAGNVGLAVQALAASYRAKPDDTRKAALARIVQHSRERFKAKPQRALAAGIIPGLAEYALLTRDETATATVFEMADWLCRCQNSRTETRNPLWIGSFRPGPTNTDAEPNFESLECLTALSAALKLTRVVPDLARYRTYRQAAVEGLVFARGLQFAEENTDHFDRTYRTRFLLGGTHLSPSDATVRIDATAALVASHLAFLQSGAETGTD